MLGHSQEAGPTLALILRKAWFDQDFQLKLEVSLLSGNLIER